MNIQGIAETAQASGYDLITIEPMGPTTLVTCERRMSNKEPWVEEIDMPFSKLETEAYAELCRVSGWDVRITSKGIRAFGQQDCSNIDRLRQPKRNRAAQNGMATEFQPFAWRRPDYMKSFDDEMPRDYWIPDM